MTDTEMQRRKEICDIAGVADIGELSDGFHTFNGLYEQRMILFAALVKAYKDKAWKSYRHEDGEYCFGGGWFIVGIDTPEGAYTYHYENKYWDMFECIDLPRAPHWDGHTEADAETRLMSLEPEQRWISAESAQNVPNEDLVSRKTVIEALLRDRQQADALMDKYLKNGYMALRADAKAERNRIEKDIAIIEQLPSAQPEQRWIPWDSGKFPEESGMYTVTAYDGATERVTYAKYQKRLKRWELTGARAYWRVLAWMPLPEPYKAESKE